MVRGEWRVGPWILGMGVGGMVVVGLWGFGVVWEG